jgi:hypothetical protein
MTKAPSPASGPAPIKAGFWDEDIVIEPWSFCGAKRQVPDGQNDIQA